MFTVRLPEGKNVAVLPLTATVPATAAPFVVLTSVKLAVLSVEFFIASEKVADTEEVNAMPFAPFAGDVEETVGRVVSGMAAVRKFQVKLPAMALPAASFAAVVTVAVYSVLAARFADGVNLAVLPLTLTVPFTVPPAVRLTVKLEEFSVELVIASSNVADIEEFKATPAAALAGDVFVTKGGVVSGAASVVKIQTKSSVSELPVASVTVERIVAV